jgi:hypothetical protein
MTTETTMTVITNKELIELNAAAKWLEAVGRRTTRLKDFSRNQRPLASAAIRQSRLT